jgi:hypothetical protein
MPRLKKAPKPYVPSVHVDYRGYAATEEEAEAFREETDQLWKQKTEVSLSSKKPAVSLCRSDLDRSYRTSLSLGGWNPVSSLSLCQEILRLHDVLAAVSLSLERGRLEAALCLLRPECDPQWAAPLDLDTAPRFRHDGEPEQREVE